MKIKVKNLGITLACLLAGTTAYAHHSGLRDSVGVENLNGKRVILHRVESGETYYAISRLYQVEPKSLIAFNNNTSLRPGLVIKVATGKPFTQNALVRPNRDEVNTAATTSNTTQNTAFIEYKVGPKETLFALSKRFGVSVDAIQKANNLSGSGLSAGQTIRIPNQQTTANAVVITDEDLNKGRVPDSSAPTVAIPVDDQRDTDAAETEKAEEEKSFEPTNKFGLKEVTASGIGVWMDDIGGGNSGKNLALHNSAPIGTVIQFTNPMNNRKAYAKVVGKFNESAQNKDAVVVISKSVAGNLGVIDRRFQVKLSY